MPNNRGETLLLNRIIRQAEQGLPYCCVPAAQTPTIAAAIDTLLQRDEIVIYRHKYVAQGGKVIDLGPRFIANELKDNSNA